jgi:hypothetical protein
VSEAVAAVDRRFAAIALVIAVVALARWAQVTSGFEFELRMAEPEQHEGPSPAALPPEPPPPEPLPYSPAARQLLGGLDREDPLTHGWVVERVEGPDLDGSIRVLAIRHDQRFAIWIRPQGRDDHLPPARTERWDIFYDRPDPPQPPLDPDELAAMLDSLAERVRANEGGGAR